MDPETLSRYQRRKQRTREALMDAAAALLVEKGYINLTIQDITDRLDLARATFYVHFRDKDEVIWALMEGHFAKIGMGIAALLADKVTDRHAAKLRYVFSYMEAHHAMLRVLLGEAGHIALIQRITATIAAIIADDILNGLVPIAASVPPAFAAQYLAGAFMQVATLWIEDPSAYTVEQITDLFQQMERGVG